MTVAFLGAHPDCAAGLDGYRAWATPDDPNRCAITVGGSEGEAHAAVVAELRQRFAGDWTFEATLVTSAPAVEPCSWCAKNGRYNH